MPRLTGPLTPDEAILSCDQLLYPILHIAGLGLIPATTMVNNNKPYTTTNVKATLGDHTSVGPGILHILAMDADATDHSSYIWLTVDGVEIITNQPVNDAPGNNYYVGFFPAARMTYDRSSIHFNEGFKFEARLSGDTAGVAAYRYIWQTIDY